MIINKFMINSFSLALLLSTINTVQASCEPKPFGGYILDGQTATDPRTGLTWMRCVVGQTWDEKSQKCLGDPTKINWFDAMNAAMSEHHGGKDDWRLPSTLEVYSLFDCRKISWAYGITLYSTNFEVFQLPGNHGNNHSGLRYDWYGALWSASSPGVKPLFNYNETSELRRFLGHTSAHWAETFCFHGVGFEDRGATDFLEGSDLDHFDGLYALLVRGGAWPNQHFEKAKERMAAQKKLNDAANQAAQRIKDNEIQHIENLEAELSRMDHSKER